MRGLAASTTKRRHWLPPSRPSCTTRLVHRRWSCRSSHRPIGGRAAQRVDRPRTPMISSSLGTQVQRKWMVGKHRVFLIGGSSHVGKSTLALLLASQLGWSYRSTDRLGAPHPGRPWQTKPKKVPKHVADHYLSRSADELITDVLRHYRDNVWPLIESIVTSHATDLSTDRLIMEGSAILPELVVSLPLRNIAAIWLTAGNELFEERIHSESQYRTKSPRERTMIDKFLERTWLYNDRMKDTVKRLGLVFIDVNASNVDELTDISLSGLSPNPPKDTDGRREDSGRGWVRELQGRWPGVLG